MSITAIPDRVFNKLLFEPNTGCWIWLGSKTLGYGRGHFNGRHDYAHRYLYTLLVGPIPDGLEIDHLCRNRACANPSHLEPVTHWENAVRGLVGNLGQARTHCAHGHAFAGANLRFYGRKRVCRACVAATSRRRRARRAQEV